MLKAYQRFIWGVAWCIWQVARRLQSYAFRLLDYMNDLDDDQVNKVGE